MIPCPLGVPDCPTCQYEATLALSQRSMPSIYGLSAAEAIAQTISQSLDAELSAMLRNGGIAPKKENGSMASLRDSILFNISSESSPGYMPSSPEQRLINEIKAHAKDNPESARRFKQAAENAETAHKQRIEKALEGAADLEVLKGAQGKRFVLKHFCDGREYTLFGIAYPGYDKDEEDEEVAGKTTVQIAANVSPVVYNNNKVMGSVYQALDRNNSPYVLRFFDE